MDHLRMPYDVASSKQLLGHFMQHATNVKLKQHFLTAVNHVFGYSFEVRLDLSKRMCFFCTVCLKEMNNIKSLQEHSASGTHVKNVSLKGIDEIRPVVKSDPRYEKDSLHYRLKSAEMELIGLQFIEGYKSGRNHYYKCLLCGEHGKVERMFNHVVNETDHTDKYIRIKMALRDPVISHQTRQQLRKAINEKDKTSVEDIIMIHGEEFYPHIWEEPHLFKSDPDSENENAGIEIITIDESSNLKGFQKKKRSGPPFDRILMKCNSVVKTHLDDRTNLDSVPDLKLALNLLNYVLHILYYYVKESLVEADGTARFEPLNRQYQVLLSCLGYMQKRLLPLYIKKNGNVKYN